MKELGSVEEELRRCTCQAGALLLILCVAPTRSSGQAAVEVAGATSFSAGVVAAAPKDLPASLPESNSANLAAREGPPADEMNRRALETRAGKDAAKLLLQSVPSEARTYIDGALVGRTPLVLIVPPGKYKVEIRGQREEFGERVIDLSPNETKQIAVDLLLRYPGSISLQTGSVSSSTGNTTGGIKVFHSPLSRPAIEEDSQYPAAQEITSPGEGNRKVFEQQAGKDAGKLILQSIPSEALTYVDGVFVGHTPVVLMVPPGKYTVKMTGQRAEFGASVVGVLPNEAQQVMLRLAVRYPTTLSLQ
jgi:PEGA domain